MKLFVASKRAGESEDGQSRTTVEGELVVLPPEVCELSSCSCQSTVLGLGSGATTTDFEVIDHPTMTSRQFVRAVSDGLARLGIEGDSSCFALGHLDLARRFQPDQRLQVENGEVTVKPGNPVREA